MRSLGCSVPQSSLLTPSALLPAFTSHNVPELWFPLKTSKWPTLSPGSILFLKFFDYLWGGEGIAFQRHQSPSFLSVRLRFSQPLLSQPEQMACPPGQSHHHCLKLVHRIQPDPRNEHSRCCEIQEPNFAAKHIVSEGKAYSIRL